MIYSQSSGELSHLNSKSSAASKPPRNIFAPDVKYFLSGNV